MREVEEERSEKWKKREVRSESRVKRKERKGSRQRTRKAEIDKRLYNQSY